MENVENENIQEVNSNLGEKTEEVNEGKKLQDKKYTFTLIYILIGLFIIAVLGMLLYAFIVSR